MLFSETFKMQRIFLLALALCATANGLDSGDNKFIKDYAMLKVRTLKIYENSKMLRRR